MLTPNAYIVASCEHPPEGDWKIPYSYFEIELAGYFYWVEDVLTLGIRLLALVCSSLFFLQLITRKLSKKSYIVLSVGLITSVLSTGTSTADGYPNSFPFICAITAICVVVLLLFHFFSGKLVKLICYMLLFGAFASIFSLFMSHLLTISGVITTGSYILAILLYYFYTLPPKPLAKEDEV
jgi:hypothetical protein